MGFFKRSKTDEGSNRADAPWYFKFEFQGKQYPFNTGTHLLANAKALAKQFKTDTIARVRAGLSGVSEQFKMRSGTPSLGELRALYMDRIEAECVKAPAPEGRKRYWRNLRIVLSLARGIDDLANASVSLLAGDAGRELVRDFRVKWLAEAGDGPAAEASRRRSGDSILRQARACFGREAMRCYRGQGVPDVKEFMQADGFGSTMPQHADISPATMRAIADAAGQLAESNPRLYLIHLFHKFAGLRNSEIEEARIGWFKRVVWTDGRAPQMMLEVSERCGFKPKASEGSVPITMDVAREFMRAWRALGVDMNDPAAHVIPAKHATERAELINYDHAAFMRRFLPAGDFAKAGYELRRWAYRTIQSKYQSREAARAFCRHALPADAGRHYQARFFAWNVLGDDVGITLADARGGATSQNEIEHSAGNAFAGL